MMLQDGEGYACGTGYGLGNGNGYGNGYDKGYGDGAGYGYGYGEGYGGGTIQANGNSNCSNILPPQYGITALSLPWAVLNANVERGYG